MKISIQKYLILLIGLMLMAILASACYCMPNLSFTEKITVDLKLPDKHVVIEITDSTDVKDIVDACQTDAKSISADCGYGVIKLVFTGGNKKVTLLPAGDGCDNIKLGDTRDDVVFEIGLENRDRLFNVLKKYGIVLD